MIKFTFEAEVKSLHPDAWISGQQWSMWTVQIGKNPATQIGRGINAVDAWRDAALKLGLTDRTSFINAREAKKFYTPEYKADLKQYGLL